MLPEHEKWCREMLIDSTVVKVVTVFQYQLSK
uniref:Uncharacterized protein n=1 Tax=Coptotermes formosanus TaxID=36987 RepID=R4V0Q3_COPFO|nr:hypothetical protein [Coptotermes formosanus]